MYFMTVHFRLCVIQIYGNVDVVPAAVKLSLQKAGFNIDNIDEQYKSWLKLKIHNELEARKYEQI